MTDEIGELVAHFGLEPHPEGGFYRETYRSECAVQDGLANGTRPASTAILFLLTPDSFSAFHRLRSDELWHYYAGDPIRLQLLEDDGDWSQIDVGIAMPQAVVRAGVWQAAECAGDHFSLCGCTVAPGFEFEDFELGDRGYLMHAFPEHGEMIQALTRA